MSGSAEGAVAATARVLVGGRPAGSAVLVDDRHLLTAWHVVGAGGPPIPTNRTLEGRDEETAARVTVAFAGGGKSKLPVTVMDLPGAAAADLAVLDLGEDAVAPAPVALYAGQRLPPEVKVFGYPLAETAPQGVWRDFAVSGATATGLQQLVWEESTGTFPGHSGGCVIDKASQALVGILLAGSTTGRFDRFLPVTVIEAVWDGLRRPWLYAGEDAYSHIRRRGTGQPGQIQGGDLFQGRRVALDAITRWLAEVPSPGRPLVITGQPGAGKSAVLARAVLDNEPSFVGSGLVFHARSATANQLMDAVGAAAGIPVSSVAGISDPLSQLAAIVRPKRRLVILVDALDEALNNSERITIATALSELSRLPWITVVVATRPLTGGYRFGPESLLRRLGISGADARSIIDLDVPPYQDAEALHGFTIRLLTQAGADHPPPHSAWEAYRADPTVTSHLARIIAERADNNFLVAALTAGALGTDETAVNSTLPGFNPAKLPSNVIDAFDKYFKALPDPERPRIRGMLTALAHARGAGITDRLWLMFCNALGYGADQTALDTLRDTSAADFLLQTSSEGNELCSRLYHQALVDQLLPHRNSHTDHATILDALLDDVECGGGWATASTYALTHAADHALDAGKLTALLDDTDFVVHADLPHLVSATASLAPAERTPAAVLVLQHGVQASALPTIARPFFLALSATHLGVPTLRDAYLAGYPTSLRPVWAHRLGSLHQRVTGHTDGVYAVTVGRLGDRNVIVSGSRDRTLRIWDTTGAPIGAPLIGHTRGVYAVAVGRLGDRDVIVSASDDHTLRIWDASGFPVGNPLKGHTSPVTGVAVTRFGDQDVIVSSDTDGTLRIWDATGSPVGKLLTGHAGGVYAVAVGRLLDRDVIISAGDDATLRIWDAAGTPVGDPLTGHTGRVTAVTVGRIEDRDVIVSAGNDATLRIWDAVGLPVGEPLTGHAREVYAVAVGRLGGREAIVSAGRDRTVRIWDTTGTPIGDPLTGHTDRVTDVAVGRLGDRDVIVSAGRDRTLRIWDTVGPPVGEPLTGHVGGIHTMTVGRLDDRDVIVSAGEDLTARIWDTTGRPIGGPLTGHTRGVYAVAIGTLGDRDVIVSAGRDRTVRIWDATGEPVGEPLTGHTGGVYAVAVGRLGDRDVIVSAGLDRTVRIWDTTGAPIGDPLIGHTDGVYAVAVGRLENRDVIVSAGLDRTVRMWDITGALVGEPLTGHTDRIWAVAVGKLGNRDVIVSAGDDQTVRVWDAAGTSIGKPLTGHTDGIYAVAVGRLGDRDVIVSAGLDRTVRIWDTTGDPIDLPVWLPETCTCIAISAAGLILAEGSSLALLKVR